MPSFEVLLPLGAIAFYLYDSLQLLYSNELVLTQRRRAWDVSGGSDILMLGRRVFLPNPLTPQCAQFRVHWSDTDGRGDVENIEALELFTGRLRRLGVLMQILALLLLFALPAITWFVGTGWLLLGLFAAFYLLIFVALGMVYAARAPLGVGGAKFAALCVDSLLCAPFAVNLLRKVSLHRSLAGDPLAFALRTFDPRARAQLVAIVDARVASEQTAVEEGSERFAQLAAFRARLAGAGT